jgi:protoporphyrinogen oxidase
MLRSCGWVRGGWKMDSGPGRKVSPRPRSSSPMLIVGAGLTGLSAAYHLEETGSTDYLLIEAEDRPGGWAKTDWSGRFGSDRAVHALYFRDRQIRDWIVKLLGGSLISHQKRCLVDSGGVRTPFPFHANLYGRQVEVVRDCLSGLWEASLQQSKPSSPPTTFEDWISRTYGSGIAKHFMGPYNGKMWTVPPSDMEWQWTADYVPTISPNRILAGALSPLDSAFGLNSTFLYPRRGISELADALARRVKPIRYGVRLQRIIPEERVALLEDGSGIRYSELVSTIPLPRLVDLCQRLPPQMMAARSRLEGLDIVLVDVGFRDPEVDDVHWVYLPDPDVLPYRIQLVHSFSDALMPPGHGMYCAEISHSKHRPLPVGSLRKRVVRDLIQTGWLRTHEQVTFARERRFTSAYAIPRPGYREEVALLQRHLRRQGIYSIGRYGEWKYSSMEDALLDGKRAAQLLSEGELAG